MSFCFVLFYFSSFVFRLSFFISCFSFFTFRFVLFFVLVFVYFSVCFFVFTGETSKLLERKRKNKTRRQRDAVLVHFNTDILVIELAKTSQKCLKIEDELKRNTIKTKRGKDKESYRRSKRIACR